MQKKYTISKLNDSNYKNSIFVIPCDTFFSKFWGLMFRKNLTENEGILLIHKNPSKIDTAIHMLFMNFDISVFWLDENYIVVDKTIAKKWRPFYISKKKANYVLETHHNAFSNFNIGDQISFEEF